MRIRPGLMLLASAFTALALAGCSFSQSQTTTAPRDFSGCGGFNSRLQDFVRGTNVDNTADGWVQGTATLAFSVSQFATEAGDDDIRAALNDVASTAAATSDSFIANGSMTTTEELAFRSSISNALAACEYRDIEWADE